LFIWNWVKTNDSQFKMIVATIVVIIAVLEYNAKQEHFRIEESLKYVTRYQEGEILKSRNELSEAWVKKGNLRHLASARCKSKQDWYKAIKDLAGESIKTHERQFHTLLNFYNAAAVCVAKEVCDEETMCSFFHRDIDAFRNTYDTYINLLRQAWDEDVLSEINNFLDKPICRAKIDSSRLNLPKKGQCAEIPE